MHIQIETSHTDEFHNARDRIEQRALFVLRRLQGTIRQVRIRLSDINGPRGGPDKQCRLTLQTDGGSTVVATSRACHGEQAVDEALARASRSLVKLQQRARRPVRTTTPLPGEAQDEP